MISAAIIVFRETLEAALILGIIAAATVGVTGRARWLTAGVLAGIAGSLVVASLTEQIANLAEGMGQELFNALVLGVVVLMLAWHNIWMARHGATLARDARQLGRDVQAGAKALPILFVVIALAVLREGSETALFLYGMSLGGQHDAWAIVNGAGMGLAAGAAAGLALYLGFLRIPTRWFFVVTSGLILFLAAAMASQVANLLIQSDLLPSLAAPLWDTSGLLSNDSAVGLLLQTLVGYDANPAGMQVIFYVATAALILLGMRLARQKPAPVGSPH
ncbi:iron permease [Halothiobacillus diazotrophicus]|uniref:Iron permease n=1 Tax=Halothiobacillus diazotrophicus TaxID=1860122 RepID=A0A191ZHH4_9GAMM|nr:FTR1 family protein [Halothiobacillus diazotrophicus]ANJ67334.1 iron permease [Halothiobacillus diazotrophicus]